MNANAVIKNFKRPPLGSHVKLWLPVSTSIENAEMTQGVCQTLRRLIQLPEVISRRPWATGKGLLGKSQKQRKNLARVLLSCGRRTAEETDVGGTGCAGDAKRHGDGDHRKSDSAQMKSGHRSAVMS